MTLDDIPLIDRLRSAAYSDNPTIQKAADRIEAAEKLIVDLNAALRGWTRLYPDEVDALDAATLSAAKAFMEGK